MWYYGQKNIILWSEKYGFMGRKIWYYGQKTGKTVPRRLLLPSLSLSHLSTVFPLLPSQSNRGSRLINFSNFFSLLKIGNPSLFLSPSFPLSVHQISRDRRHSFANLTFQHTLIHFGGRLLLSIETFTLPPLQLLNLLEGIWSDRRGGRTLDAHSSLPFCGLHSRANLANRFREHLSLFHIM